MIHPFTPSPLQLHPSTFVAVLVFSPTPTSTPRKKMGQEEAVHVPAAPVWEWEHEPLVLKPVSAPAVGAPDMPERPTKAPAPATVFLPWKPESAGTKPSSTPDVKSRGELEKVRKAQAPTRRLSVPPPPGRSSTRGFSLAVRPEDDPFLAAYLACTKSTGGRGDGGKRETTCAREPKKGQVQRRWPGFGLGGLSCKRGDGGGGVAQSMVRLAKLPELDPRDV